MSDCLDCLLCYYLRGSWYKFKSRDDGDGYMVSTSVIQEGFSYQQRNKDIYRRFLDNDDYLGIVTPETLAQLTRGNDARLIQAEESTEISIVEYLSESYEVGKELTKGKYIAEYDRQIICPVGVHVYFEEQTHGMIRSANGYRKPTAVVYWEESSDIRVDARQVVSYSQFSTYYPGDKVSYNDIVYTCLNENGYGFDDVCIPLVGGWVGAEASLWQPVKYPLWAVIEYEGTFYTLMTLESFGYNLDPMASDCWGAIADYGSSYSAYGLSEHEYIVCDGRVFCSETSVNADTPQVGRNLSLHDPRSYNLKKHMVRLVIYGLTRLIAPNNVSVVRVHGYKDNMEWLNDATKLQLNPQVPRKIDDSKKPVTDQQLATSQTDYDSYKNPWMV